MEHPILIAGATGGVGQNLVAQMRAAKRPLRAFVRDMQRGRRLFGPEPDLVVGDTRQTDTLPVALENVRMVICATGTRQAVGDDDPQHVDYEGVCNLVTASVKAGVERFVLVSTMRVTDPNHPLNEFGRVLDWKLKGENVLRESGLNYTIVRPGGLTDDPGACKGLRLGQGDAMRTGLITRSDVAEICLRVLDIPTTYNATFEVINNDDTPRVTDWAAFFSELVPDHELNTNG
ncbi:MAG: SDR family oxidoreductase [Chloroflexi bacterium]|nr:SDR family oxidoreductase [Chloroflexota bacterium]